MGNETNQTLVREERQDSPVLTAWVLGWDLALPGGTSGTCINQHRWIAKSQAPLPCCDGRGSIQCAQEDQHGCSCFSSYLLSPALKPSSPEADGFRCSPSFPAGLDGEVSLDG